jgi:carbonic anhydrase
VSAIDQLLAVNGDFAASHPAERTDAEPSLGLAIVTCMDARLDLFAALGLSLGGAHILRNAGGIVTDDVIRSLAISQRRLGTRETMLIHHTGCGMQALSDNDFSAELEAAAGAAPSFAIGSFSDVDESVRQSIQRIRRTPFLPHREIVRGFVYDVETHRLREVDAAGGGSGV